MQHLILVINLKNIALIFRRLITHNFQLGLGDVVNTIFINAIFNLNSVVISWFSFTSNTLILAALFCIGAQIKIKQIRDINSHNFLYALTLWFFALVFSCSVIFLF